MPQARGSAGFTTPASKRRPRSTTSRCGRGAADAGIDVIVPRGSEGGGHGRNGIATLPLLQGVLDRVSAPVLAAGGIASAGGSPRSWPRELRRLAGHLVLGVSGVVAPEQARARVLAAGENDTISTRGVRGVALGYPWPAEYGEECCEPFLGRVGGAGRRSLLATEGARRRLVEARSANAYDLAEIDAGQGVGLVRRERSAAEVIEELTTGALDLLGRWPDAPTPGHAAVT